MKIIRSAMLFLFVLINSSTYAQGKWPRNVNTNAIEVNGNILWPPKIKTSNQRILLMRQWFLKKMTDAKKDELVAWIVDDKIPINYGSIPGITYLDYRKEKEVFRITFDVQLKTNRSGMIYHLSNFEYVYGGEDMTTSCSLEVAVVSPNTNHAAINLLKKRLETSLSKW